MDHRFIAMPTLFEPLKIKNLTLPVRLVRSATAERQDPEQAESGRQLGAMYAELVRGGIGLLVAGHIGVHPNGRVDPRMPGLYDIRHAEIFREATAITHAAGGLLMAQLNHAGGRAQPDGVDPVCVSFLPDRPHDPMRGAPLDSAMIEILVAAFARSAGMAQTLGMDGVEIHAAHGYLGSQFLSLAANRRQDNWGGSIKNRSRFLRTVIREIRAVVGSAFPVGMKLGAVDGDPSGLQLEDSLRAAEWFQEDGLDFIEISGAFHADICARHVKPGGREGYFLPMARHFKERLSIPVIAVGGFRSLAFMNEALESGACDAIAASRPLIRQPNFLHVLRRNEPIECISCNLCLFHNDQPTQCYARIRQAAKPKAFGSELQSVSKCDKRCSATR